MSARQKMVTLYGSWWTEFFGIGKEPHYKVIQGLPKDARLVRVLQDEFFGNARIVFESEEWDELKDGDQIPHLDIVLRDLSRER